MSEPVSSLERVAQQVPIMRARLKELRDLIDFSREVGQDVTTQETEYNNLLRTLNRWEEALRKRGISLPPLPPE